MTTVRQEYRTTKTSTKRLVRLRSRQSLERIISLFPLVTYVNMETDKDVIKARKLIESLKLRVGK